MLNHREIKRSWPGALLLVALHMIPACTSTKPRARSIEELFAQALEVSRRDWEPTLPVATRQQPRPPSEAFAVVDAGSASAGPLVSDFFVDTDVRDALRSLASQAGVNLVLDDQVRGRTNAQFEQVAFDIALQSILLPLGYHSRKSRETYLVGVSDPGSALFSLIAETYEFRPAHLEIAQLVELLPLYARANIRVSEPGNIIVVRAPARLAQSIMGELERLDQPIPQVMFEAIICAYAPDSRFEFAADGVQGFRASSDLFGNLGLQQLTASSAFGPEELEGLRSFKFTSAFVRALESEGYLSVRASPRVMARNGMPARIHIGKETYFTVGDPTRFVREAESVRSGIVLDILPRIRGSQVLVDIRRAEVSDEVRPSDVVARDQDSRLPTLNTRNVSTTVQVADGQTIVIGGLVQRREVERIVKVPFLGDIPGLGWLFSRIDTLEEDVEIAIFISPRIIREDAP